MVNHNHHPLPGFLKVLIPKGFKFLRMNTCRSVDSRWVIGEAHLYKSNCRVPEGSEGTGARPRGRRGSDARYTKQTIIKLYVCHCIFWISFEWSCKLLKRLHDRTFDR